MTSKLNSLEDAFVCNNCLVFRGAHCGGFAGAGVEVELPPLANSSGRYLVELEEASRAILRIASPGLRLQINWSTTADYRDELLAYHESAENRPNPDWSRQHRGERFTRMWKRHETGNLRRERLRLFFSQALEPYSAAFKNGIDEGIAVAEQGFSLAVENLELLVQRLGGRVRRLDDDDLANEYAAFLNPLSGRNLGFSPDLSMLENFLLTDGVGVEAPDVGFYLGGAFHAVLALKSLPQATYSGITQALTGLSIQDFSITVNVSSLDLTAEIEKAEDDLKRLGNALRGSPRVRMESAAVMKREKIDRLMSGAISPMRAQFLIRTWDKSKEGAHQKLGMIKAAIGRMRSAKPYEFAFPNSAVNAFRASSPGWAWDRNTDFSHYIEDLNLAHLLPLSGSSGRSLLGTEAIYDGHLGDLIGISGFSGEAGRETSQHTFVTGKTGSGKSLFLNDLLTQTNPYYDFTVIIDDGLSYQGVVERMGGKTLIIEPGGTLTFNYWDPQGPLTKEHMAAVVGCLMAMCGFSGDHEFDNRRAALLSNCVDQFYRDVGADWLNENDSFQLAKDALVFSEYAKSRPHLAEAECLTEYRSWKHENPEPAEARIEGISAVAVSEFLAEPDSQDLLLRLSFALIVPEEMPTHTAFRDWLEVQSYSEDAEANELRSLAVLLTKWTAREGIYGCIFDGVGNVDLRGPLVHIELGRIPESAKAMKEVVAFIITNQVRNAIMRRPRSERKRVVIEEVGAFLTISGGEQIVRDFYERMRKYSTWVIAVIQQVGIRLSEPVFASIVGNSRQGIFFKQSSALEADAIAAAFRLSNSARDLLLTLPEPSKDAGAFFLHCDTSGEFPAVTVGCNVVHEEMLAVAGSSGMEFEARRACVQVRS